MPPRRSSATLPASSPTPRSTMTTDRLRPAGAGARIRPHGLGDGARLRRDRSMLADAQRRFNAVADEGADFKPRQAVASPSPRLRGEGRGEGDFPCAQTRDDAPSPDRLRCAPAVDLSPQAGRGEEGLTPLTLEARALYEGGVVPVRALARLCGVSLRTLYNYVHQQGWRRRRSAVPRDKVEVGPAAAAVSGVEGQVGRRAAARAARLEGARSGGACARARCGEAGRRVVGCCAVAGDRAAGRGGEGAHIGAADAGVARCGDRRRAEEGEDEGKRAAQEREQAA